MENGTLDLAILARVIGNDKTCSGNQVFACALESFPPPFRAGKRDNGPWRSETSNRRIEHVDQKAVCIRGLVSRWVRSVNSASISAKRDWTRKFTGPEEYRTLK